MPIYEYRCQDCQNEFEALTRPTIVPKCPRCHSDQLDKLLSVFATSSSATHEPPPVMAGPCGSCGHPDGPGACAIDR